MIIGLTGRISSGKSLLTDFLKEKSFVYLTLSKFLKDIAVKRDIVLERKALQDLGNELRKTDGNEVLAKYVVDEIKKNSYKNVVIESIRNPYEVKYLRENLDDFYLISFDAPREKRFQWHRERKKSIDPLTFNSFVEMDDKDFGIGENESGQGVGKCMELADYHLINDGSLEEIQQKINEIYDLISSLK